MITQRQKAKLLLVGLVGLAGICSTITQSCNKTAIKEEPVVAQQTASSYSDTMYRTEKELIEAPAPAPDLHNEQVYSAITLWTKNGSYKRKLSRSSFVNDTLNKIVIAGHYSLETPVYKVSAQGKEMIKRHEGCSLKRYYDGNSYSIGYGHFIKKGKSCPKRITQEQADEFFEEDIQIVEEEINHLFNQEVNTKGYVIPQCYIDGVADFMYNCGTHAINKLEFHDKIKDCTNWGHPERVETDLYYCAKFIRGRFITAQCRQKNGRLVRKTLEPLRQRREVEANVMQKDFKYLLYKE